MTETLYLIKLKDGKIKGPYSKAQIFDLIYDSILEGKEQLCEYPSGQWFEIGAQKDFYEAFLGQIKIENNNTYIEQNTVMIENEEFNLENIDISPNESTIIYEKKNDLINVKDTFEDLEKSPLIPQSVISIEKRKTIYKRQTFFNKIKNILTILLITLASYYSYDYYTKMPKSKDTEIINIDNYSFKQEYIQIKLPEVDSADYNPSKSDNLMKKAQTLIIKDNIESFKKAIDLLHESILFDTTNMSALTLLTIAYARVFDVSEKNIEYTNAIKAILYRAQKGDTNLQNLTQAQILEKLIHNDYLKALDVFNNISSYIKTIDPNLLILLSEVYMRNNDYNTAYKALQNIANSDNNRFPRLYYLLGLINLSNNQKTLAETNFKKALEINKDHLASKVELILLGLEITKNTEILKFIKDNIENLSFTSVSKLLFFIAKNQFSIGKNKLAKQIAQIALNFDSTNNALKSLFQELGGDLEKFKTTDQSFNNLDLEKFEKFMIRGDFLFSSQDYRDAILQYKMATSIKPKDITAWFKLAETYRKTYEYDKAIDTYIESLKLNKFYLPSLSKLARTYIHIYDLDSALEYIKTAKNIDPQNPDVLFTLGYLYDTHGKEYEALKYYHESLVYDFSQVDALFELGKKYFKNRDYENARLQFKKVITVQPNFYPAYIYLIQISSIIDHEYQFKKYYEELLSLFPSIAEINAANAMALIEKQNISEAQAELDKAIRKNKYSIISLSTQANLDRLLGKYKEAIKYLNTISILAPYYFPAISMRINIYQELGDFESKENELIKLSKLTPYYPSVFYDLATMYYFSGKTSDAITSLKNQIEFQPNNFNAYVFLGDLYLDQGKTQDAISLFRQLLSKNPKNPFGLIGMAQSFYYAQDFDSAKTYIEQARIINSEIPEIYLLECKIFEKISQNIEALDRCSEFIRMSPTHYRVNEAKEILQRLQGAL